MSQTLKELDLLKVKLSNKGFNKTARIAEDLKNKILKYKRISQQDQVSIEQFKFLLSIR